MIVFEVSQLKGEPTQLDNPGCGTYFYRLPSLLARLSVSLGRVDLPLVTLAK